MSAWAVLYLNVNVVILSSPLQALIQKEQSEIQAAVGFVSTSRRETLLPLFFCVFAFPWVCFALVCVF